MRTEQQVLDERASVWSQMQTLIDTAESESRNFSGEEAQTYDRLEKDLDKLTEERDDLARRSRHATRGREFNAPAGAGPNIPNARDDDQDEEAAYRAAFSAFLRNGTARLAAEQRTVLETGVSKDPEVRALAVGTGAAGGYLVPNEYRDEFIKTMKAYGAVIDVATVINTDTGAALSWPTMNDTANVGAILAENTQMAEQDLAVGTAALDAYMYTSKLTRASYQLVQDSAFNVEATVRAAHAERIGRILNQHFTTGTGTAQPTGIVTGAVSGKTAASGTAITADELIDLQHSVDPAYRSNGQFMLSDAALAAVRKLKDTSGQYLWQPAMTTGSPSTLLGAGYVVNPDMAAPAVGVKSVLFGDFRAGYVVRLVTGLQVITFTERYADFLQVAWASYQRAGGTVQNTAAYKALTQAAV